MHLYCNGICILLLIGFKSQPDDDRIASKHAAVWVLYKVELDVYLFIPDFINIMFLCQKMLENCGICDKCTC
jgi:hypothetical protein